MPHEWFAASMRLVILVDGAEESSQDEVVHLFVAQGRRVSVVSAWRRQEESRAQPWANRIGEEAARLYERSRLLLLVAYLCQLAFTTVYWTGSAGLNAVGRAFAVTGLIVGAVAVRVDQHSKAALAAALGRPRWQVRRAPRRTMATFDAWLQEDLG